MTITILLILITLICHAPEYRCLWIGRPEPIQPYEKIWLAICQVESENDPHAYHMEADGWPAVGIAQIRWIRLREYNKATGHQYQMKDMYDVKKSKQVFMYYASKLDDPDLIIRRWNGSGKSTYSYLKKVKTYFATK